MSTGHPVAAFSQPRSSPRSRWHYPGLVSAEPLGLGLAATRSSDKGGNTYFKSQLEDLKDARQMALSHPFEGTTIDWAMMTVTTSALRDLWSRPSGWQRGVTRTCRSFWHFNTKHPKCEVSAGTRRLGCTKV